MTLFVSVMQCLNSIKAWQLVSLIELVQSLMTGSHEFEIHTTNSLLYMSLLL